MFNHILVPLDGSPMSEAAVVVAAHLARRDNAEVTLLHVLEDSAQPTIHGQPHLTHYEQAVAYLERIAKERFPEGVKVGYHVHRRPVKAVAQDLARHASIMRPDLIILCAHGGVRLRDRILGNIAQQIVDARDIPVLMIQSEEKSIPCPFRKMLVLLDGGPEHEIALIPATSLAQSCGAEIVLMHVIETGGTLRAARAVSAGMLPNAAEEMMELERKAAEEYLQSCVLKFGEKKLSISGCIDRGDPAERIVDYVRQRNVDLVVLATHGKAGSKAFWAGTLPPKLMRRLRGVSFLLVPAAR
jgi:nucleotide-binding universal stress UspA family protein